MSVMPDGNGNGSGCHTNDRVISRREWDVYRDSQDTRWKMHEAESTKDLKNVKTDLNDVRNNLASDTKVLHGRIDKAISDMRTRIGNATSRNRNLVILIGGALGGSIGYLYELSRANWERQAALAERIARLEEDIIFIRQHVVRVEDMLATVLQGMAAMNPRAPYK